MGIFGVESLIEKHAPAPSNATIHFVLRKGHPEDLQLLRLPQTPPKPSSSTPLFPDTLLPSTSKGGENNIDAFIQQFDTHCTLSSTSSSSSSSSTSSSSSSPPLIIGVDATSTLLSLIKQSEADRRQSVAGHVQALLLPDFHRHRAAIASYCALWRDLGVQLLWFFDGPSPSVKDATAHSRLVQSLEHGLAALSFLALPRPLGQHHPFTTPSNHRSLSPLLLAHAKQALKDLGQSTLDCWGEADPALAAHPDLAAVISADSDFFLLADRYFLPSAKLTFDPLSGTLSGLRWHRATFFSHLAHVLPCQQLPFSSSIITIPSSPTSTTSTTIPSTLLSSASSFAEAAVLFSFLAGNDYSKHLVTTPVPPLPADWSDRFKTLLQLAFALPPLSPDQLCQRFPTASPAALSDAFQHTHTSIIDPSRLVAEARQRLEAAPGFPAVERIYARANHISRRVLKLCLPDATLGLPPSFSAGDSLLFLHLALSFFACCDFRPTFDVHIFDPLLPAIQVIPLSPADFPHLMQLPSSFSAFPPPTTTNTTTTIPPHPARPNVLAAPPDLSGHPFNPLFLPLLLMYDPIDQPQIHATLAALFTPALSEPPLCWHLLALLYMHSSFAYLGDPADSRAATLLPFVAMVRHLLASPSTASRPARKTPHPPFTSFADFQRPLLRPPVVISWEDAALTYRPEHLLHAIRYQGIIDLLRHLRIFSTHRIKSPRIIDLVHLPLLATLQTAPTACQEFMPELTYLTSLLPDPPRHRLVLPPPQEILQPSICTGYCKYPSFCILRHLPESSEPTPPPASFPKKKCFNFIKGTCKFGNRCFYIHQK